jgi:hypothetical protein
MSSHLQQVIGGFSSRESHNFRLDRDLRGEWVAARGGDGCSTTEDGERGRFVLRRAILDRRACPNVKQAGS